MNPVLELAMKRIRKLRGRDEMKKRIKKMRRKLKNSR
jgi:hypothetical protein